MHVATTPVFSGVYTGNQFLSSCNLGCLMFGQYDRIGWISYIPTIPISTYIHSFGAFTRDGWDKILIHYWHPISTSTTLLSYKERFIPLAQWGGYFMFDSSASPKRIPCRKGGPCYLTSKPNPGYLVYIGDCASEL